MKKLVAILLILSFGMGFSQTNVVQEGYYEMIDSTGNVFDTKQSEKEVIQAIYNYYINTGLKATYRSPNVRVDFDDDLFTKKVDTFYVDVPTVHYDTVFIATEQPKIVNAIMVNGVEYREEDIEAMYLAKRIDTLIVTQCFEDYNKKIWLWTDENSVWIPFKEVGFSHVYVDSLPDWKKMYVDKWKVERTIDRVSLKKTFRELEIPFQFYTDSIVEVGTDFLRVRVFGNEDWYPEFYVNGVKTKTLTDSTPGSQDFNGVMTRRHTCTIDSLQSGTNYSIKVKGYSRLREETDEVIYDISTK
jgi:hypothetical protein